MWPSPDSVVVLGQGAPAARFALSKVLRQQARASQGLLIIDALGRGAMLLDEAPLAERLTQAEVVWYDLADRRKPVSLAGLTASPQLESALGDLLDALRQVAPTSFGEETLRWAVQAGVRLAAHGAIGLGSLLKALARPEARRWCLDTEPAAKDLDDLLQALRWALHFPAVSAAGTGPNLLRIEEALAARRTVWVEATFEHFEPAEHHLALAHLYASLRTRLTPTSTEAPRRTTGERPIVVHLFPPGGSLPPPAMARSDARHILVVFVDPDRPLHPRAAEWVRRASHLWVSASKEPLSKAHHASWATAEELDRLAGLRPDQVFFRDRQQRRTLVVRSGLTARPTHAVQLLRRTSAQRRRPYPGTQLATLFDTVGLPTETGRGLHEKLCDVEVLRTAWFRIKAAGGGSHGSDGVTVRAFSERLDDELAALSEELRARRYQCRPLFRVYLQKPDGGQRPIGVLCVRDRVVQSACLLLLDPIFDPTFSHFSFAFRPRRSAHQAIAVARGMIAAGHAWAVTADIRKCFDRIDHEILLGLLAQRVGDPALLELIRHWLTAEVLELGELQPVELGVPQGAVISPLLANIYLDPLDQHLTRLHLPFVRYADDLLIFADDEASARRDLGVLGDFLREVLHLELKPSKVQHAPVADGVVFLGFTLRGRSIEIRADRLTRVAEEIRSLMATLGAPGSTFQDRVNAFGRIAAVTRGFRNYFLLPDEPVIADQLGGVDGQLEMAAHELLPQAMREDPAWICRERFAQSGPALESQPAGSTTSPESTYPRESVDEAPVPPRGEEAPGTGAPSTTPLVEPGADDGEADDHGLLLTDGRLFVMAHGLYLCLVKPDSLAVKKRKVELAAFPLADLQLIYLQGIGLNVSVELQLALAERDTLVIFAPPVGQPLAFLTPIHSHRAHLRGQQVLRREDPDLIAAGVAMVSAKTTNQAAVLRYFGKYKARQDPEGAEQLAGVAKAIRDLASRIESVDRSAANLRAMVMGLEGQAASMYWQQLVRLVPEGLQFDGRAHENATDPLNQAVNYLYGILYGEVWRAITSAGLDPYFGLIHGSQRNQGSLVFDLIEEFRAPFADRVLLALLGRGFRPETGRGGRLRSRVRRKLASAFNHRWHRPIRWHGRRIAPAGVLLEQARSLAKLIRREGAYQPYRMRW